MAMLTEGLPVWTRRLGLAHFISSFFFTAFAVALFQTREPIVVTLGWVGSTVYCTLTILALATAGYLCFKAPDQDSRRRAGRLFLWPIAAQGSLFVQALFLWSYFELVLRAPFNPQTP
jgi:hypothetical protein